MISSLMEGLFDIIVSFVNTVLSPINSVINEFFPDLNDILELFYNVIDNYISPFINYAFHLLPPNSMHLLLVYLSCLVAFYTITLAMHVIVKVLEIIENVWPL